MITKIATTVEKYVQKLCLRPMLIGTLLIAIIFALDFLLKINLVAASVILSIVQLLFYVAIITYLSEEYHKKACFLLKISFTTSFITITQAPVLWMMRTHKNDGLAILLLIVTVMPLICTVVFFCSDSGKKVISFLNTGFFSLQKNNLSEVNPGDIVLCKVKEKLEAGEADPREILPYKDRFLHMLVLGPTGSGKTSQVLLPMVYQDIQNTQCGITVIEPKGDYAKEVAMMAKHYDRPYFYFDPSLSGCPHFNPMAGAEVDVVENMATTFKMLNPDSPQFFLDLNEQLMRNSVKVLKRLDKAEGIDGKYATLIRLSQLLQNSGGKGRELVNNFSRIVSPTQEEAKENADIASWFLNDYFPERSKVYENTSGVRSQVAKIISNKYLRDVLNPDVEKGEKNEIDFDKHLEEGGVICISTAQGSLRDLSRFLGYFIILQFQSAVFRRPGDEDTRRPHFLYIDEFQTYSTPGFGDMLTQGRSYRVASHLATQNRSLMAMGGGRDGRNFVDLVSTNARNVILYPGCSYQDAKYYSDQFGEYEKVEEIVGINRKRFDLLTGGLDKLGHPTETVREMKSLTPNFTPTDLIYREFGEIVYCIIKNNSIQTPKVGIISYIPQDLNKKLKQMADEYTKSHTYPEKDGDINEIDGQLVWDDDDSEDLNESAFLDLGAGDDLDNDHALETDETLDILELLDESEESALVSKENSSLNDMIEEDTII